MGHAPAWQDLLIKDTTQTLMQQFLTMKIRNRLKAEAANPVKTKQRDTNNALFHNNINKIVMEESNTNSGLERSLILTGITREKSSLAARERRVPRVGVLAPRSSKGAPT